MNHSKYFLAWLLLLAVHATAQVRTISGSIANNRETKRDSTIAKQQRASVILEQVTISSKKVKTKKAVLGKRKIRHDGGIYMINGEEVAIYFKPSSRHNAFLKNIFIYVTDEGIPQANFKVHVYKFDSDNIGTNLMHPVIAHATQGDEWVKIDVSKERIPANKGLYVSIEWIPDSNDTRRWHEDALPKYYVSGNRDDDFNGQVIGLTWGYGRQLLSFVRYANDPQEWQSANLEILDHNAIRYKVKREINPMVYCTYTYYKR